MNTETITILVLVFLGGSAFLFRRWYIHLPKTYKVSEQHFGSLLLTTTEHNPRQETARLELLIQSAKADQKLKGISVEFISMKREITKYSLDDLGIDELEIQYFNDGKSISCQFEKRDLMRGIRNLEIKRKRFRFVVELASQQILKSHDFYFSSKYMLARPDSGRYN